MKYVPGLMVGQLSGKAGNTVASRNKGGSYIRTRVIPKHVVNPLTSEVRANFGANSQLYTQLTDTQRMEWTALGSQITRKTSLGETIHLTGLQALQSVNRNLNAIGQAQVADAPDFDSPPELVDIFLSASAGVPHTTTVTVGADSATQQVGSTTNMYAGQSVFFPAEAVYRQVQSITDATHVVFTSPVNSTTAEALTFTGLPTITLDFDNSPIPSGVYMVIEATAPLSAGVSRPSRGQFRQLAVSLPTDTSPVDLGIGYAVALGQPPAGSKIFVRVKFVTATGFAGSPLAWSATVS